MQTQKNKTSKAAKGGDAPQMTKRKKAFIALMWICAMTPVALLAAMLTLTACGAFGRMPSFEELENPKSNLATEIYADNGDLIGSFFIQNRAS